MDIIPDLFKSSLFDCITIVCIGGPVSRVSVSALQTLHPDSIRIISDSFSPSLDTKAFVCPCGISKQALRRDHLRYVRRKTHNRHRTAKTLMLHRESSLSCVCVCVCWKEEKRVKSRKTSMPV